MCLFFMFTLSINTAHMQCAAAIPKGFFPPGVWGICALRAYCVDGAVEGRSDAGPLHKLFVKLEEFQGR